MSLCALCVQLKIEDFAFRNHPAEAPFGGLGEEAENEYQEASDSDESLDKTDEDDSKDEGRERRLNLGLINNISQRERDCILCKEIGRHLSGLNHDPHDTYEVIFAPYGYITTPTRRKRVISHIDIVLVPEAGDTAWGPFLPQEQPSVSRRKTVLELQECSLPIPRTSDFAATSSKGLVLGKKSRFSGRLMSSQADLSLISYWINNCKECHGDKCAKSIWPASAPQVLTSLLLIDVHRMCIVDAPESSSYVAHSYCWGRAATLKHMIHNSSQLRQDGAFLELEASIPATIRDAISLVKGVGERFLWVGALCIIQDDLSSQKIQLAQMGLVYSLASFVIIAAAGDDANAGLPGIRSGTRQTKQNVLHIGDNSLVTVIDGSYYKGVESSQWVMRAWTMQEKVLAKRTLIFTKEQIYWRCWGATWLEETVFENVAKPDLNRHYAVAGPSDIDFSVAMQDYYRFYEMLVVTYMQRQLSFKSDTVNAFTGISQALSAVGDDTFHWGLPESQFGKDSTIVAVPCPSWSWTARMNGSINTNWINWEGSTEEESDIIFYRQGDDGALQRIRHDTQRGKELPSSTDRSVRQYRQWIGSPQLIAGSPRQDFEEDFDQGHLHFWTSSAKVWIRRQTHLPRGPLYSLLVPTEKDDGFEAGGNVYIDSSVSLNRKLSTEISEIVPQNIFSHIETHNEEGFGRVNDAFMRELIVIGRGRSGNRLSALVIEWDEDVAYRIGIARVEERTWVRLTNREWKRVILG